MHLHARTHPHTSQSRISGSANAVIMAISHWHKNLLRVLRESSFFAAKDLAAIQKGSPLTGATNEGGLIKIL